MTATHIGATRPSCTLHNKYSGTFGLPSGIVVLEVARTLAFSELCTYKVIPPPSWFRSCLRSENPSISTNLLSISGERCNSAIAKRR